MSGEIRDVAFLDATAQAELVRRGELTARELVESAIARIERLDPRINAVIAERFAQARDDARRTCTPGQPFGGVPFLLKDLDLESAGDPLHCGMRLLRQLDYRGARDSHLVTRFRRAGLIILGKTNTPELGLAPTTEPAAHGPTRNPWDVTRSAGGSSGGAAAAVAAGMVPIAHASDGGGSIRIPASACGLVGFKPSRGRISLGPEHGEKWAGLVVSHVLSRTVRDTAIALDAVGGPMPGDPYFVSPPSRPFAADADADPERLRIGLMVSYPGGGAGLDPVCIDAVRVAGRLLEGLGHDVEIAHPEALDDHAEMTLRLSLVVATSVAAAIVQWSERLGREIGPADLEPDTAALLAMGRAVTAEQYVRAVDWIHGFGRRIAAWYSAGFDILVTPTLAAPPPALGTLVSPPDAPLSRGAEMARLTAFTPPFNLTGQPAVSLPLHWTAEGWPVGVQFIAEHPRDDLLVRLAASIERASPWAERRPPVAAP